MPKRTAADIHSREFLELQAKVAQAVSGKSPLTVSGGLNRATDDPLSTEDTIRTLMLSEHSTEQTIAHMRGQVDLAALVLRHHSGNAHRQSRPAEPRAASLFDALELVRVEALGSKAMEGVAQNIAERHATHCDLQGYARYSDEAEPPLADIVGMIAREALTGAPVPEAISKLVAVWKPLVEPKLQAKLPAMQQSLDSQANFSEAVREFLVDMEMLEGKPALCNNSPPFK